MTKKTEYLLDTNVCIAIRDLIKDRPPKNPDRMAQLQRVKARWLQVAKEQVFISPVTLGELRYGAHKSQNPTRANHLIDTMRKDMNLLPLLETTAEHYGDIRSALEKSGHAIGHNDLWIAAHGRAAGCTVVTHNTREFVRVPRLALEDWATPASSD